VKQLDSVESLRNEPVERVSLNECILNAGHGLYTWQSGTIHGQRKWRFDLHKGVLSRCIIFKWGTRQPYLTRVRFLTARLVYIYSIQSPVSSIFSINAIHVCMYVCNITTLFMILTPLLSSNFLSMYTHAQVCRYSILLLSVPEDTVQTRIFTHMKQLIRNGILCFRVSVNS
jgi:hypothetical protein